MVFYPFAFSPVCTDQFQIYEEALRELAEQGATLYGVSTDAILVADRLQGEARRLDRAALGLRAQGRGSRVFGAYFEPAGMTNRALVIVGPDGTVAWSHLADSPGDLPGVNLIFDGLASVGGAS